MSRGLISVRADCFDVAVISTCLANYLPLHTFATMVILIKLELEETR